MREVFQANIGTHGRVNRKWIPSLPILCYDIFVCTYFNRDYFYFYFISFFGTGLIDLPLAFNVVEQGEQICA